MASRQIRDLVLQGERLREEAADYAPPDVQAIETGKRVSLGNMASPSL